MMMIVMTIKMVIVILLPDQLLPEGHLPIMLTALHGLPRPVDVFHQFSLWSDVGFLKVCFPSCLDGEQVSLYVDSLCVSMGTISPKNKQKKLETSTLATLKKVIKKLDTNRLCFRQGSTITEIANFSLLSWNAVLNEKGHARFFFTKILFPILLSTKKQVVLEKDLLRLLSIC